jgi:hypothetical protein
MTCQASTRHWPVWVRHLRCPVKQRESRNALAERGASNAPPIDTLSATARRNQATRPQPSLTRWGLPPRSGFVPVGG